MLIENKFEARLISASELGHVDGAIPRGGNKGDGYQWDGRTNAPNGIEQLTDITCESLVISAY